MKHRQKGDCLLDLVRAKQRIQITLDLLTKNDITKAERIALQQLRATSHDLSDVFTILQHEVRSAKGHR